jgi:hypothetical protein
MFAPASGNDSIIGFNAAVGDRLDLQGQTFVLSSSASGDTVLTLSGGGIIELDGVASAAFATTFII